MCTLYKHVSWHRLFLRSSQNTWIFIKHMNLSLQIGGWSLRSPVPTTHWLKSFERPTSQSGNMRMNSGNWMFRWQCPFQDSAALDLRGMGQVLPPHLMEERLIRQQQEMEEDQRWLEKEERFLVTLCRVLSPIQVYLTHYCRTPFLKQKTYFTSGPKPLPSWAVCYYWWYFRNPLPKFWVYCSSEISLRFFFPHYHIVEMRRVHVSVKVKHCISAM